MKKIFYLILLSILLVVPGKVEALSLTPTSAWSKALYSDGYDNVTPVWNGTYYVANLSYSGNGLYISDIGFVYNNVTLCDGGNFSIQGNIYVYADDPVYKNSHVYFNYGSGDLACQTSYYSNYTGLSFTCTGKGLYNKTTQFMVFDINYEPDYIHQTRFLNYGIVKDFNVSCELSDEDVIANQNANTNSIINNQNLNKNEIINNQTQNQQQTNQRLDEANNTLKDMNSNLTDSNVSVDGSFFSGFESDDYGLSSIITAPLNLIKSITSSTCTPIGFEAPFVNQRVTLPCMGSIYKEFFGSFLTIYQTITFGMVAYWVSVKIFFMVKGFKDPDSDRIEVLDL